MKSKLLSFSLLIIISFSGISQSNCNPILDSNTVVLKSDTVLTSCATPYSYLICQGVKVTYASGSCTVLFYLENNAKLVLDSINNPGSLLVWAKNWATIDANFQRIDGLNHETATNFIDTNNSLPPSQTYVCPTLTYDYSKLPGGVSGCGSTLGSKKTLTKEITFEAYPNPATNVLNIKTEQKSYTLKLINILGKVVWEGTGSQIELNFPKGIYFLQLKTENNPVTKKVVLK